MRQRRWEKTEHRSEHLSELSEDHPAAIDGRTRYPAMVIWPGFPDRLLKSGRNNLKIGARVERGPWAGMDIYTLTLEERATCPSSCHQWLDCYGNKMHFSERLMHGRALEWRLGREIWLLSTTQETFVVRLHVLGDFYSVDYVKRWLSWIRRFPGLHVYGYTSWPPSTPIGALIKDAAQRVDRFAVRWSNGDGLFTTQTVYPGDEVSGGVFCPAQVEKSECCATCGLCWNRSVGRILFRAH